MEGGSEGGRRIWIFDVWKRKLSLTGLFERAVLIQVCTCAAVRQG